ncbi:MAG: TRZ/ATZ family hydrolase [Gammaproteobacteria bacterium]|nr:TRZ/ATZ family hydrolase [Rhodocyclaceae bacterium]MBU3908510.1 TRZ/ATZ family hydrolase [Gammaproteobacteria bacterium]MBU3990491.1 TRZ/ATZ family hydrolase [Gammaproteobacteria bacterium]MBU4004538.1 TRZ/ATZ family hydrolase [Gammaproteobacteria bacterium]MBU4021141.1 TRZ/ATZ family hydrolase [Gammaproteobacteria bacterium]
MVTTADHSATAKQQVDQIIDARWIIPIEPANVVLENHSLIIQGDRILDLLPTAEAALRYVGKRHFRLTGHVLLPGLINLHTHAAMSLLRGYADDMPLMRWLQERIWPAESRNISADFVHDGTRLACWEMLRGGITCFNDMYFFPQAAADAALSAGMRAALGITVFEFPSAYGSGADDYLRTGLAIRETLLDEPLISFCLAPHAPYTVADNSFEHVALLADQLDLPVHIHLHETRNEIEESLKEHGVRPLERLRRLGLLGPGLIAVHAVHLDADEIDLLATHGCHVAHCPTSNMKLASGIAPVNALLKQGVGVGLGSDGAASNNRLDIFQEMRHAALLAKVANQDASSLPAHQALRMATIDGARALGLDEKIGSLKIGKAADLVAVRLDSWDLQPCYCPASHLVYAAGREQVSHVWVAGTLRIEDKHPVDLDIDVLLMNTKMWQNTLIN